MSNEEIRSRIVRSFQRAEHHAHNFRKALLRPEAQRDEWEQFLQHWKQTIERLNKIAEIRSEQKLKEQAFRDRQLSPELTYAWEARNFEEHDIYGSSKPHAVSGFGIGAADPSQPVFIDRLEITKQGNLLSDLARAQLRNAAIEIHGGRLEMQTVVARGGRKVDPPAHADVGTVMRVCLEYASRYMKMLGI
ncbi:MAG: hypothetical protein LDL42_02350 [Rhizobium sp.]|nr:hypothetical protein [Rhizobium sp.]